MTGYSTDFIHQILTWWIDDEVEIASIDFVPESTEECVAEDRIEFTLTMSPDSTSIMFPRAVIAILYIDWEKHFMSCAIPAKEFDIMVKSYQHVTGHSENTATQ